MADCPVRKVFTQSIFGPSGSHIPLHQQRGRGPSRLGVRPKLWPILAWELYENCELYSHPQIDGKVSHHQISRDLLFHLFGDDYSYVSYDVQSEPGRIFGLMLRSPPFSPNRSIFYEFLRARC